MDAAATPVTTSYTWVAVSVASCLSPTVTWQDSGGWPLPPAVDYQSQLKPEYRLMEKRPQDAEDEDNHL